METALAEPIMAARAMIENEYFIFDGLSLP